MGVYSRTAPHHQHAVHDQRAFDSLMINNVSSIMDKASGLTKVPCHACIYLAFLFLLSLFSCPRGFILEFVGDVACVLRQDQDVHVMLWLEERFNNKSRINYRATIYVEEESIYIIFSYYFLSEWALILFIATPKIKSDWFNPRLFNK